MRNVSSKTLFLLVLTSCSTTQLKDGVLDPLTAAQLDRWTRDLALLEAEAPEEMVRGAEAEVGLRFGLTAENALKFVEANLLSENSRDRRIAAALVRVNCSRVNDHTYLQISPKPKNLDAAALQVDLENLHELVPLIAEFLQRKGLRGKLSDYYQMNESDAGAGVAYRLSDAGRLETVSYDKYLAMPWVEDRDITRDFASKAATKGAR